MLSFVFRAPEGSQRGPLVLVLIIERENMVRMAAGDPFDIHLKQMARASDRAARVLNCRPVTDLDIVVAYEDPGGIATITNLAQADDLAGIVAFIERGRTVYKGEPADPVKLT